LSTSSIFDATIALQKSITQACEQARNSLSSSSSSTAAEVSIKLEKGDYAIKALEIPKNSSVTLFSKDRVRLLYIGKRNRPMFLLEDNSSLILKEKLEIYYNSNNIQEVMRLIVKKTSENSGKLEISKGANLSLFSQKVP
jgi:hypothetical protein